MITILNCDWDNDPEANYGIIIPDHLSRMGAPSIKYDVFDGEFPSKKDISSGRGVIITGSWASAYEEKPWINELSEMIKFLDKEKIPTFGICFGFQIIAHVLGGKVVRAKEKEKGFKEIQLTPAGKKQVIFQGLPPSFKVYESHNDIVSQLPNNSIILSRNQHSIQAYFKDPFICVQFHPEMLPETAVKINVKEGYTPESILNGISYNYRQAFKVFENFVKIVENIT